MNNQYKTKIPNSKQDFERYYYLRWKILRKPYGKELGTETDEFENSAYHLMIVDSENNVIAVAQKFFSTIIVEPGSGIVLRVPLLIELLLSIIENRVLPSSVRPPATFK